MKDKKIVDETLLIKEWFEKKQNTSGKPFLWTGIVLDQYIWSSIIVVHEDQK